MDDDMMPKAAAAGSAPLLGEDTEDFLTALGLDEKKIGEMAAKGIVICGGGDRK